ncbi:MAG: type II secretion system protein GspC [Candidatus Binataceae bacterium]
MEFNLSERYVMALNLVLIAAIAWFAARAAGDVITLRLASNVVPPATSGASSRSRTGFAHGVAYYDLIVKRDIFNLAPPQTPEKAAAGDEPLPITLLGTSHLTRSRPYAIVQDQNSNQTLYRLGDTIKGVGKLVEVDADRIVVLHNGHRVAVELPRYDMQGQGPQGFLHRGRFAPSYLRQSGAEHRNGVEKLAANRYIIDRSTVQNKMHNMAQLFTQIRAVPDMENGASDGFRLSEIQPGSIFQQIGLQDGDVLTAVSGQSVTDPAKAMELLEDLRDQRSITLNVMRNGSPMQIFYSIR